MATMSSSLTRPWRRAREGEREIDRGKEEKGASEGSGSIPFFSPSTQSRLGRWRSCMGTEATRRSVLSDVGHQVSACPKLPSKSDVFTSLPLF
jgi:hypothetical protein